MGNERDEHSPGKARYSPVVHFPLSTRDTRTDSHRQHWVASCHAQIELDAIIGSIHASSIEDYRRSAAIDRQSLARDMPRGLGGKEDRGSLNVMLAANP